MYIIIPVLISPLAMVDDDLHMFICSYIHYFMH